MGKSVWDAAQEMARDMVPKRRYAMIIGVALGLLLGLLLG